MTNSSDRVVCIGCDGSGWKVQWYYQGPDLVDGQEIECSVCAGLGYIPSITSEPTWQNSPK
jgi:hypothetical protein